MGLDIRHKAIIYHGDYLTVRNITYVITGTGKGTGLTASVAVRYFGKPLNPMQ